MLHSTQRRHRLCQNLPHALTCSAKYTAVLHVGHNGVPLPRPANRRGLFEREPAYCCTLLGLVVPVAVGRIGRAAAEATELRPVYDCRSGTEDPVKECLSGPVDKGSESTRPRERSGLSEAMSLTLSASSDGGVCGSSRSSSVLSGEGTRAIAAWPAPSRGLVVGLNEYVVVKGGEDGALERVRVGVDGERFALRRSVHHSASATWPPQIAGSEGSPLVPKSRT